MMDIGTQFLTRSVYHLREDYLPKIKEAVDLLEDLEIWLRESDTSNSVGNLLLHLAGNVRQHLIAGVGGKETDQRDRPAEFAAVAGMTKVELLERLISTVHEACDVLEALDPSDLLTTRVIQGKEVLLLDDVFHVVEHFGYHTGQIVYVVKAMKNHTFPWYAYLDKK